jgi:hypothetical protein
MPSVQVGPLPLEDTRGNCFPIDTCRYSIYTAVYDIQQNLSTKTSIQDRLARGLLVDRGANGGMAGEDVRPFRRYQRMVDVTGIGQNLLTGLEICDCAARTMSTRGPIIVIFLQYAYYGKDRSIHSAGQLEHYGNKVFDQSMKVGGKQCIVTKDGYIIPLDIVNGLPYLKLQKHTDAEWEELPHVVMTGPGHWNP